MEHSYGGEHQKTRQNVVYAENLFPLLKSVPQGVVTLQKNGTHLQKRFPTKQGAVSKILRTMTYLSDIFLSKGVYLRHAFSPLLDPIETRSLDHWYRQHLHSLSTKRSDVS